MLTGAYHLSRRKTKRLLHELFDISISLGAVSAMERRASEALASCHEEALREVQYAGVKHTDATSWVRSGNSRRYGCRRPLSCRCTGSSTMDVATRDPPGQSHQKLDHFRELSAI
jgi:hypothetical protein